MSCSSRGGLLPFFSFFGAKAAVAHKYPAPVFDTVIEPFAGAAGYATLHYRKKVVLVERDERQAALWRYLIRVKADEIMGLPDLREDDRVADLKIADEAKTLIGFWCQQGVAAPAGKMSSWMKATKNPSSWWGPEIRARLASQVSLIRHWKLIQGDYSAAPDIKATWHIDPPYQLAGETYRYSSKRLDFDMLGLWCMRRRGQIMVCENMPASWLPFKPFLVQNGSRGKSVEAIWQAHRD